MQENRPGLAFEAEVAEVLQMRGFSVVRDFRSDGFRADLIVSRGQDPFRESYVVEAKDHERPVGNEDVLKLGGAVNSLQRSFPGLAGLLVSRNGFSADAKKAAASQNIRLTTLDQLIDGLIDFTSYLRNYVRDYQERRIFRLFVDPAFSVDLSTPILQHEESLVSYLLKWPTTAGEHRGIILLGEYGVGKTAAAENFCYRLAKRIIEGHPNLPVPILIHLKNFTHALHDLRYLITSHLVNELNTDGRYAAFIRLLRRGKIILLLDGFDEMAMAVDETTRDHNFILLQTLCTGDARVVITGRPEYFPSDQHLTNLISDERHLLPAAQSLLSEAHRMPKFAKLQILPFDQQRISTFLSLYENVAESAENYNAESVAKKIRDTYDLKSLASRPVLLDLIVKTLPRLSHWSEPATAATLYDQYTRFWLDREEQKGRKLIPRDIKEFFVLELAWRMITKGRHSIHYTDLPMEVLDFFNPQSSVDPPVA